MLRCTRMMLLINEVVVCLGEPWEMLHGHEDKSLVVWIFDGYIASLTDSPQEILTACVLALKLKCTCHSLQL